jgi:hypothetical protein
MKVNSIQTSEFVATLLRSSENNDSRVDVGKGPAPEPSISVIPGSAGSSTGPPLGVQAQTLITHINYTKDQLDKILVSFPPFFPAGSYQRIDLIKSIRGIQDQVEKSSVQANVKQEIASSNKLSEKATDSEISAALDQLFSLRDELSKGLPAATENPQPGALVSIKV